MREREEKKTPVVYYKNENLMKDKYFIGMMYKASNLYHKIVYLGMLNIQKKKYEKRPDGLYVTMTAGEIIKEIGSKSGSIYETLKNVANELTSVNMGIVDDENQRFTFITMINKAVYENGKFTIRFAPDMEDRLIGKNFTKGFTSLPKIVVMAFKKPYTFPLYQLLKSQCFYPSTYKGERTNIFSITIGLSELKLQMGVVNSNQSDVKKVLLKGNGTEEDYDKAVNAAKDSKETMFNRWGDFEKRCLEPCVKEINDLSELYVEYTKHTKGYGGKVYAVEFTIWSEGAKEEREKENFEDIGEDVFPEMKEGEKNRLEFRIWENTIKYGFSYDNAVSVCKAGKYNEDKILEACSKLERQNNIDDIANKVGWLINCIRENYEVPDKVEAIPKKKGKKNSFHNFEQRDYDFDQLEEILLNTHV